MSRINNVRLPNAISAQYNPEQFNQLVRSVEQIVLQLNSTYNSALDANTAGANAWFNPASGSGFSGLVQGPQFSNGIMLPYAMLMSDQDQASAGATSVNLVTYNKPILTNGIGVESNSRIKVSRPGQYLVTVSVQVTNRDNASGEFELWARSTGQNYPLSNTRFDLAPRKSQSVWSHVVAAIAGIFTVFDPVVEYLEIAWWSDRPGAYLEHYGPGTNPVRPSIPSVILTINFISAPGGTSNNPIAVIPQKGVGATAQVGNVNITVT
jgi:hypothetical protein